MSSAASSACGSPPPGEGLGFSGRSSGWLCSRDLAAAICSALLTFTVSLHRFKEGLRSRDLACSQTVAKI